MPALKKSVDAKRAVSGPVASETVWQSKHQRKSHWSDLWLQIALELSPSKMTTALRAYVRVGTCACVRMRACVCACARVRACARARVRVRSWRFLLGSIWNQIRPGLLPQRAFIENFFPRGTWLLSLDDDIKTIYKKKADGSGEERVGIEELTLPTKESSIPMQTQSNICSYQSNLQRYEMNGIEQTRLSAHGRSHSSTSPT